MTAPTADDVTSVLSSVGIEVESEKLDKLISELSGKSIEELIAEGNEKIASAPGGGAASGAAPAAGSATEAAAEEEVEEEKEESDDDMGFALGPIGIQIGILNTVQQCSCINSYIFKNYLIAGKLNKVFDTTLCLSGMDRVVIPGKLKRLVPQTLGTQLLDINPLSIILSISHIIYIVFISLIPILGTIITEYNHILNTGSSSQTRFWQLSRKRPRQQKYYVKEQEGLYLSFGFVCQIMENIPIFGLFFTFTDTIGAAILAKDVAAEANKED
ncbi:60S acidic ribosomal protein P2 [Pichia californica]|nr:60S acidic ribosomal protein P2 [[Candida] californica]